MADVYHHTMRASIKKNLLDKLGNLLIKLEVGTGLEPNQLVAIKIHFGEKGNSAYIRPIFVRKVVDYIRQSGLKVFLTDTNTLYRGSREDAATHVETAITNGFAFSVVNAPIVIACGLRANDESQIEIPGEYYDSVPIGNAIVKTDGLMVLTHFKGHEVSGFGGAIKNLGMGCASRKGKLSMHSTVAPKVIRKKCKGDRLCEYACTFKAISIVDNVAVIDREQCTGCGECLGVCPHSAIAIQWNAGLKEVSEKMAEFALGAVQHKADRCWYVNFVTQVSPACDCYGFADAPIVPDLGIFASKDPVSLDQACYDAVTQAEGLPGTALKDQTSAGVDKFKVIFPQVEPEAQLIHAEKIGLGSRSYNLIRLG